MENALLTMAEPAVVAARGQEIYDQRYRAKFERAFDHQFAAINVNTGKAYVKPYPEDAMTEAMTADVKAIIHLICIGREHAFDLAMVVLPRDAEAIGHV